MFCTVIIQLVHTLSVIIKKNILSHSVVLCCHCGISSTYHLSTFAVHHWPSLAFHQCFVCHLWHFINEVFRNLFGLSSTSIKSIQKVKLRILNLIHASHSLMVSLASLIVGCALQVSFGFVAWQPCYDILWIGTLV